MILTNEEIEVLRLEKWANRKNESDFARAVERAVLEKLCAGVEMPEAVANVSASSNGCIGFVKPDKNYYTADQLQAYGAAQRLKALEDAAKYLEDIHHTRLVKFAAAIRALKGEA